MLKAESQRGMVFFVIIVFVLAVAFFFSLLIRIATFGEEYRLVIVLEYNSNSFTQHVQGILQLGILPIAAGLILCVMELIMQRRDVERNLGQLVIGALSFIWGAYYALSSYSSYSTAIGFANESNFKGINGSLQTIYICYVSIGILWLSSGILLSVASWHGDDELRIEQNKQLINPPFPHL